MLSLSVVSTYVVAVFVVALILACTRLRRSRSRLPPGPKALPLIGNVLAMPRTDLGPRFARMGDRYGSSVCSGVISDFVSPEHFAKRTSIPCRRYHLHGHSRTADDRGQLIRDGLRAT